MRSSDPSQPLIPLILRASPPTFETKRRVPYNTLQGIVFSVYIKGMSWQVFFHPKFAEEHGELHEDVQDELAAMIKLLKAAGPELKRPGADTLNGSDHANMKELRFKAAGGVWRVAYAFDPERKAILLVAGDKSGGSQKKFYKSLIKRADDRFNEHLGSLEKPRRKK